jgi:hypothetical protein
VNDLVQRLIDEPFRPDEQRVCDYLMQLTEGQIGCGDDPIGFAQNEWWRARTAALEAAVQEIVASRMQGPPWVLIDIARRALEPNDSADPS